MKKSLGLASRKSGSPEFRDLARSGSPDPRSWKNVQALLKWEGVDVRRNDFTGRDEVDGQMLCDDTIVSLVDKAHRHGLRVTTEFMLQRLKATALEHRYHPAREYFDNLVWDRDPRLDTWLSHYLGADESRYANAVGAATLIAAVRRVREPGTKFDTMLILEGVQGTGKSSALKILAGDWFTDCVSLKHESKVIIEQTEGKLVVEVPELSGMRHTEVEHVKANLSRTTDRARLAYAITAHEVPRQFVMIGTTNVDDDGKAAYLKDPTGNRRFWPVLTDKILLRALARDRDQLWAEAAYREKSGEPIQLPQELWASAGRRQKQRMVTDPYFEMLRDRLGDQDGKISVEAVWSLLDKKPSSRTQTDNERLGRVMKQLRFERHRLRDGGEKRYFYVRGPEPYDTILF